MFNVLFLYNLKDWLLFIFENCLKLTIASLLWVLSLTLVLTHNNSYETKKIYNRHFYHLKNEKSASKKYIKKKTFQKQIKMINFVQILNVFTGVCFFFSSSLSIYINPKKYISTYTHTTHTQTLRFRKHLSQMFQEQYVQQPEGNNKESLTTTF